MTPLGLRAAAGVGAHMVSRPRGVLHAYVGPLTPSGRRVPRAGRAVCKSRTRTLTVVPLATVGARPVCGACVVRLANLPGGTGHLDRSQVRALYADVTPFDLAVDAWRAQSVADVERLELVALAVVGLPALRRDPVIAPTGKTNPPLDQLIAKARLRVAGTRDHLGPAARAAAKENEHQAREAARLGRKAGWRDREARIERLGINIATRIA